MNRTSNSRQSYTVVAVLLEHALSSAEEHVFRVTVSDGSGPCGIVLMAQPQGRSVPLMAGAILSIDPRLVETTP